MNFSFLPHFFIFLPRFTALYRAFSYFYRALPRFFIFLPRFTAFFIFLPRFTARHTARFCKKRGKVRRAARGFFHPTLFNKAPPPNDSFQSFGRGIFFLRLFNKVPLLNDSSYNFVVPCVQMNHLLSPFTLQVRIIVWVREILIHSIDARRL